MRERITRDVAGDDEESILGVDRFAPNHGIRVDGGSSADELYGSPGDDHIYGGAGNDILHGGRGSDQLHGGKGQDELYAGGSSGAFVLTEWARGGQGSIWDNMDWFAGDFTGDGVDDFGKVWKDSAANGKATADVHENEPYGSTHERWATGQGGYWDSMDWMTGDFNGDGKDDLMKV